MRSSVDSGITIVRRSLRAMSCSWCSNISGVITSERCTCSAASSAGTSTCSEKRRRATSTLRGLDVIAPSRRNILSAAVNVPSWVMPIGSSLWMLLISRAIVSGIS